MVINSMPYKDPEKARQRARERYKEIKSDPIRLAKRREQQRKSMAKWRKNNPERNKEIQRRSQHKNYNKDEHTEYQRTWLKNHPYNYEKYKQKEYERDRQKKLNVIIALGGKCKICGNDDFRVLCGHHINGRKGKDINDTKWYRHPPPLSEIQLLCMNCHTILHSKLDNRGLSK